MTCIVIALVGDTAHVFADTAHIGPTGALVQSKSKIRTFADKRFAIAVRGSALHSFVVGLLARRCHSLHHARQRLARALCGRCGRLLALAGPYEAYFAGIDPSDTAAACLIVSHRLHPGVKPWTPVDIPYHVSTGPAPGLDPADDPVAFGIRAAQLQRGVLQKLPFARRTTSIVGGELQHVAIGPDGVKSDVLGGWFDRLGDRLNPAAKFSADGARVRPAERANIAAWFLPTTRWGIFRFFAAGYAVNIVVHLLAFLPGAIRVETVFHNAPQTTVETAAGAWDAWARLDLGKILTSPTPGREAAAAAIGRKTRAADHAEAARAVLAALASTCTVETTREVLLDEYEHALRCK